MNTYTPEKFGLRVFQLDFIVGGKLKLTTNNHIVSKYLHQNMLYMVRTLKNLWLNKVTVKADGEVLMISAYRDEMVMLLFIKHDDLLVEVRYMM